MLLSVQLADRGVRFDLHSSFDFPIESFISYFPLWSLRHIHVAKPLIYGEFPICVLNSVLPVGVEPCQFVWDMFITALYDSTISRY